MRKTYIALLSLVLLLCSSCSKDLEAKYSDDTVKKVTKLSFVSNPCLVILDESQFKDFLSTHANELGSDSDIIKCCNELGTKLIEKGINGFSKEEQEFGYARALDLGASMEQAREISFAVNQQSVDEFTLGKELLWLSKVIPSAAQGDMTKFNNPESGNRKKIQFAVQAVKGFSSQSDMQLMKTTLNAHYQHYEKYVLEYASMLCK